MVLLRMSKDNEQQQQQHHHQVENSIKIGDRVQVGHYRATVNYVGPVESTKGLWLGLDWDDPSRGKHNGVYKNHRYFNARYPTSGSLVRLEKVELGQTICEAIKSRYSGPGQIMPAEQLEEIRQALNTPFLELVGLNRPTNEKDLNIVGLADYRVSSAGKPSELANLCPRINDLDLSKNLISDWQTLADVVKQLPYLRFLDISENRLAYDTTLIEKYKIHFKYLKTLIMSKMEYTWLDITCCARIWPQIEKLQISFNNVTLLSEPKSEIFFNLKLLNIEGNDIKYWKEIEKLGRLPRLECLNASNLGLTNILINDDTLFPSLKFILLSNNYINNWESINELSKLKKLNELKFRHNPIIEGITRATARQILIARIPNLIILNSQEINVEERRGAEIDYLKSNAREWSLTADNLINRKKFLLQHPLYQELIKKYGEIDINEISNTNILSIKSRLININLVHGTAELHKKVPDTMLISTLASLAFARLMHGYPRGYQLNMVLISAQEPNLKIPLDDKMKSLSYYSIADGDVIRVE